MPLIRYPHGFNAWLQTDEGQSVWREFERRALQMARVRERYSARAVAHRIRWDTAIRGGDDFKLNNNWISGLARHWMLLHGRTYPQFFQLRDNLGHKAHDTLFVAGERVPF